MAEVLASIRPDTQVSWEEIPREIPVRITADAVRGWVEDLAFEGELSPARQVGSRAAATVRTFFE